MVTKRKGIYLKEKQKETLNNHGIDIPDTVRKALDGIKQEGEVKVRELSKKFDNWDPDSFRVSEEELKQAEKAVSETFKEDTKECQRNVREFAKAQLETLTETEIETEPGITLGQKLIPISNVGVYVPGGRYPMVASAHMSVIPPNVVGCGRVIACTPPTDKDGITPGILYALDQAGADEIYALGGIQAIGAMAYGTENIKAADFIAGPGNAFVAEAKRQVFGKVGIDQIAGPSEILVLADETADPEIVAADIWGQSEHDYNAVPVLVTTSQSFAKKVMEKMDKQLPLLETKEVAKGAWDKNGEVIVAKDIDEAIEITNDYAIEHLEVHTENLDYCLDKLTNYGSLFLGEETTVSYGDKGIGTNHILPTGGAAKYTGGLWVGKFIKTVTYQKCTKEASVKMGKLISRQCHIEGMHAHAVTADKRIEKYS